MSNSSTVALEAQVLDEVVKDMHPPLLALIFEFLFYGVNLVLTVAYFLLSTRQKDGRIRLYPLANLTVFVFATAGLVLSVAEVINEFKLLILAGFASNLGLTGSETLLVNYRSAIGTLYTTANFVADLVLIYRCYIVWGSRKRIVALPAFISLVNCGISFTAVGLIKAGSNHLFATSHDDEVYAGDKLDYAFLGINIFENVLLTLLIAGRIWWISRTATKIFGGNKSEKRYNAIIAMFLESGLIYPVALIICLVVQATGSVATMAPVLLQIVGIAPNIILLRAALGVSFDGQRHDHDDKDIESTRVKDTMHHRTHSAAKSVEYPTSNSDYNAPGGTFQGIYRYNGSIGHSRVISDSTINEEFSPFNQSQFRTESRPMLDDGEREVRLEPLRNQ